ncbi:hypothetical protein HG535_0A07480 [Zygotorulaspora mrakii]|uniref:aminodeoxychorismate synthase n=1 Tax=Zygotorulaspora mrakii TaxID=42260 RepID=A0A7H9AWX5_ZYGMR|nr:uncharacterized protein HG535_0A07480 [Zygotorulaspora mrakii]QLG70806.1 hypothetical protein HG535_0A07480 [Zygotorulaspora mrakii]
MIPFNVLFIDSYDSFTYNVVRLIERQHIEGYSGIHVTTIRNDTFRDINAVRLHLPYFDCIIVGPGPGNPLNGSVDVGIINSLFCDELADVPILGICLGFQAMCLSQGASIKQLETIKHGQVYPVEVSGTSSPLFEGHPETFKSVRYHSLHVCMSEGGNSSIVPLAYTSDENGKLLMAASVEDRPWFGVQYHPESCCSDFGGLLVKNFLQIAHVENITTKRMAGKQKAYFNNKPGFERLLKTLDDSIDHSSIYVKGTDVKEMSPFIRKFHVVKEPSLALKICDKITASKFIMTSATVSAQRGEWSIIALPNECSDVLTHYSILSKTTIHKWKDPKISTKSLNEKLLNNSSEFLPSLTVIDEDKSQFWITAGKYMKPKLISNNQEIPFIGGLVGTLGYEMGYHVHNNSDPTEVLMPDAKLVFIHNSIVIDHIHGILYCISLSNNFPQDILQMFDEDTSFDDLSWEDELPKDISYKIAMPTKEAYAHAFNLCQGYMHKGDSYEMCLTTQTRISPEQKVSPWRIFQTLALRNPAPFASFFEFNDLVDSESHDQTLCLISSSPERFLKWDVDSCELRPIKGTVKKSASIDLAEATKILKTPKEFGENLMILDLIRNDLYELLPDVHVENFMCVEEYKTVYQLVSVVKAYGLSSSQNPYTGMDVLRHSFPPGSMTGAPKKITVELLQDKIEPQLNSHLLGGVRGIYSGVTGYWSANGNGDWSVNIRCMFSYNSGANWQIGAGGAITVLSTLEGELEEMYTKLESALQIFK